MKSSSNCNSCGEDLLETGNYEVRIIKAKRIPKKARKLMRSNDGQDTAMMSQTKFGRFLLSRSRPKNRLEITCGNCSISSRIPMRKPTPSDLLSKSATTTPSAEISTIDLTGSTKKRKKKKKKDLTAGLCIPASLNSSISNSQSRRVSKIESETPLKGPSSSAPEDTARVSKFMTNQTKAMKATVDKQKEMDNLKKVLFKSKKKSTNVGTSLQDFLSSMQ